MNRERLTILRDHLAGLPDEQVKMSETRREGDCGTVACIMGWAEVLWPDEDSAGWALGMVTEHGGRPGWGPLIMPPGWMADTYTRSDAIAAIQSMLDSPDDDALPVWPSREGAAR